MRVDGRKANELRETRITPNYTIYAEGSALIEVGKTIVLCSITVENKAPRWKQNQGIPGGWITAEYSMLPRATLQRTSRETSRLGGRTHEIRRLIGRSLRAAVDLSKLGPRTCIVDCDVLQADGGTRTAAITGGYVALAIALQKLVRAEKIPAETMIEPVGAVSVGVVNGIPLLDLCYEEDHRAEVDANIVINASGQFIEVQTSAESNTFSRSTLDELLNLACLGIGQLLSIQKNILDEVF